MKKTIFTLMACALTASSVFAQWNTGTTPAVIIDCSNAGTDYYACNPKAARTPDGKTWLSYKIWEENGVHTFVQLLDRNGVKQFDGLGIKLNDYQTPTWWSEYQLAVANDGSAIVSLADSRSEVLDETKAPETIRHEGDVTGGDPAQSRYLTFQPAFYKISQKGDFEWGLDGITFTKYQRAPYTDIFVNGDDIFIQFTDISDNNAGTYMNRISLDGVVAFDECKPLYGQLVPSLNSDMLVVSGNTIDRVDRDLESVWDAPVQYDSYYYGGYEMRPYKIATDGEGGAAVAFVRNMGDFAHNIRLQYINADGELGFGLTGIDTYNAEMYDHDYPNIALNKKTKEIMVDWESMKGIYTQTIGKYSFNGDRHWGELGIDIASKDTPNGFAYGRVGSGALSNGDWILVYRDVQAYGNEKLTVMRLNPQGEVIWKKNFGRSIEVSSATCIVEEDATYVFFRGKNSLDMIRVFNTDGSTTAGIDNLQTSDEAEPSAYYSIDGKKLNSPQKGINIVRMTDGTTKKVVLK